LHKRDAQIARIKQATAGKVVIHPPNGGASAAGPLPHYTEKGAVAPIISSEAGPATLSSSGATFSSAAVAAKAADAAHYASMNGNGNGVVPPLALHTLTNGNDHSSNGAMTPVSNGATSGRQMNVSASTPTISNRMAGTKGRKNLDAPVCYNDYHSSPLFLFSFCS
jgi:hypothetical protein